MAHGDLLSRFADAVHDRAAARGPHDVAEADDRLEALRGAVVDAVGERGLVDAAAICANFNMMVRIADGTGTPLDEGMVDRTTDLREQLGLDALPSRRVSGVSR